jgi:hypothetical protein
MVVCQKRQYAEEAMAQVMAEYAKPVALDS